MTFYFIAGEPSSFMTMANMAYIIKKVDPNHIVEAIVPYHGFLAKMEVQEFLDEFDRVWRLPSCDFHKNVFRGFFRGRAFKKAIKSIAFNENSIAFAFISREMSLNLLIKHITERCKSIKIFLLSYNLEQFDVAAHGGKLSRLMELLNRFYSLVLGCYPMKSYINANGQLMHRKYCHLPSFSKIVLAMNQTESNTGLEPLGTGQMILPYPVVQRYKAPTKKQEQFVVFFGDATVVDYYTQLDRQFLINKSSQYVNAIRDYYAKKNIRVYYKPHPYDGEKLMAGCESAGFPLFKERINAEMLFSKYHNDIVAVYTISSHSVVYGSMNGIPAYWAYEICFSDEELKDFFRKVTLDKKSKLLKSLTDLGQIGSIDDEKIKIDMKKMEKTWENGIQILTEKA